MAKDLAREIGYVYVDTGAMYRAVTLYAMRNGMYDGEPDKGIVSVNTGIDVIRSVVPAAQVVRELMADFLRYAEFVKAKEGAQEASAD